MVENIVDKSFLELQLNWHTQDSFMNDQIEKLGEYYLSSLNEKFSFYMNTGLNTGQWHNEYSTHKSSAKWAEQTEGKLDDMIVPLIVQLLKKILDVLC